MLILKLTQVSYICLNENHEVLIHNFSALGGSFEPVKEEDDEYDAAIKERKAKQASNS